MKIIKYLGGGLYPSSVAVDYNKIWLSYLSELQQNLEGSQSSSQGGSSRYKSDEKGAIGIFTKSMTDDVMEKVLPVDGRKLIDMSVRFEDFINPFDPASSTAVYSGILLKLQLAKYEKEMYVKAVDKARDNGALHGPAIATDGTVWVKSRDRIGKKHVDELSPADRVLTVAELALLRAYNPQFANDETTIIAIDNAVSMKQILEHINAIVSNIGETNTKNDAYLTKQQIEYINGLLGVLNASIDGVYKLTVTNIDNRKQANSLIDFVYATLDNNLLAYLTVLAKRFKITALDKDTNLRIDPVRVLLMLFILGKYKTTSEYEINFEKDITSATLGNDIFGSKDGKSGSDKGLEDITMTPALLFYRELGQKEHFTLQVGGVTLDTIGTVQTLHNSEGHPMGWASLTEVAASLFGPGLSIELAHFGGYKIQDRDKILVDGSKVVNMYLPVDTSSTTEVKPNFALFKKATELQKKTANLTDVDLINQIYQLAGLPKIFKVGANGERVLTPQYARFAVMKAYADKKALPKVDAWGAEVEPDDTVTRVKDDLELETIISRFKGIDKNYTESKSGGFAGFWRDTDIYTGLIFIPLRNNLANWGMNTTAKNYTRLETALYHTPQVNLQRYNPNVININNY